jgi:hypothetical protein
MCHQSVLFEDQNRKTSANYVKFRRTVGKIKKELEVRNARKHASKRNWKGE